MARPQCDDLRATFLIGLLWFGYDPRLTFTALPKAAAEDAGYSIAPYLPGRRGAPDPRTR